MTEGIQPRGLGRLVPSASTCKAAVLHLILTLVAYAGTDQRQWRKAESGQPIEQRRVAQSDTSRRAASASSLNYRPSTRERVAFRLSEVLTLPLAWPLLNGVGSRVKAVGFLAMAANSLLWGFFLGKIPVAPGPSLLSALNGLFASVFRPRSAERDSFPACQGGTIGAVVRPPSENSEPAASDSSFLSSKPAAEAIALMLQAHKIVVNRLEFVQLASADRRAIADAIRQQTALACEQVIGSAPTIAVSAAWMVEAVIDQIFGMGPIEPLVRDPSIDFILIRGPRDVLVESSGAQRDTNVAFLDDEHVRQILDRLREGSKADCLTTLDGADGTTGRIDMKMLRRAPAE